MRSISMRSVNKQGSALLMLMLGVASVVIVCYKDRFATSLLVDVALKKEAYEKKWWAAHGLLAYGIAYGADHFLKVQSYLIGHPSLIMTCASWPCGEESSCSVQLIFVHHADNALRVTAQLGEGQQVIQGSCILRYSSSGETMVSAWHLQ